MPESTCCTATGESAGMRKRSVLDYLAAAAHLARHFHAVEVLLQHIKYQLRKRLGLIHS